MKQILLVTLLIAPLLRATPIPLQNPAASFSQTGYSATATIDSQLNPNNGWAVAPQVSSTNRIWWSTPSLASSPQARSATFTLSFRGTNTGAVYNMRRFIIAYTTGAAPSAASTWTPLIPIGAATSDTASGTLSADLATGKISLTGLGSPNYEYRITADLPANTAITGFSVQVFPAEAHVGTHFSGNFVLTEFSADLFSPVIPLTNAGSTFAQAGFDAGRTIDSAVAVNNGWAVSGGATTAQRIWWRTSAVPASSVPQRFQFTLNFRGTTGSFQKFNIKRFLLACTTDTTVSNTSAWTLLTPITAEVTGAATGGLSINPATSEISLTGGDGEVSMNYLVTAEAPASAAITGFSLRAVPVSGKLGTDLGGNFVLGEVTLNGNAPYIVVPASVTISEDGPPDSFALRRAAGSSGSFYIGATTTGTAAFPTDYARSYGAASTLDFSSNSPSAQFTLTPVNDALNEGPETIIITWTPSPSYTLSAPTTTITIGDTDGTGYDDYMAGHGLTAAAALPTADPNGDGISNLAAYVFRLNPAGPFPDAWRARLPRFTTGGPGPFLPAITWQMPGPFPLDVHFSVQESTNLQTWTEVARRDSYNTGTVWTGTTAGTVEDSGTPRTVTVRGTQSTTARRKAFLRLVPEKFTPSGGI